MLKSSKKGLLLLSILAATFVVPLFAVTQQAAEAKALSPGQVRLLAKYGPILKARAQRNHKMTTGGATGN